MESHTDVNLSQNAQNETSIPYLQQPLIWNIPAVDSALVGEDDDDDSALGSHASTRSTFVSERIYDYRLEHGRRYHALHTDADYPLPNDENEIDRLDLQHHLFRMTLDGKLHRAPVPQDCHHVLDVGTGTGLWAIEFAEEYPSATVIGTDLSPIQAPNIPPNCRFYIEDAEGDWDFDHFFDFIHGRMLVVGFRNWHKFFTQAHQNLKPGGWIEMQDLISPMPACDDGTAAPDSPLMLWAEMMRTAAKKEGIDLQAADSFPQLLAQVGFIDIQVSTEVWPLNRWPKDEGMKTRGAWAAENFANGIEGFSLAFFTKHFGMTAADVRMLVEEARAQIRDRRSHCYIPILVVWARKPLDVVVL